MNTYPDIGIQIPRLFLPRKGIDLTRWAVIACDQFTSEPEYWQKVEALVGSEHSTYHLILPEAYLEKPGESVRIKGIQEKMRKYLKDGILVEHEGMVFVQRTVGGRTRSGIMLCLDLECYDFTRGSASLIRATEGTIIERLPPRMKVRFDAALELPHILVLIDDPEFSVMGPIQESMSGLKCLYDFDLMLDSGHLMGVALSPELQQRVIGSLRQLADPAVFSARYGLKKNKEPVLLFAMGDGNHSLATAKAIWERIKPEVGLDHPARYALVEVENIHDPGLEFEAIHRVLFGLRKDLPASLKAFFGRRMTLTPVADAAAMIKAVDAAPQGCHLIGLIHGAGRFELLEVRAARSNLPVGTLQSFLDGFMSENGADRIDYIHGADPVCKLGLQPGNAGFYVPGMQKSELFKTVILDGALPRKTFSMGEAREKRFYMEARKIEA